MSTRSVIAEPYEHGWRGRYVHNSGYPWHMGAVLYDAVTGHFNRDVSAARDYFLHQHTDWRSIGGNFTQPTGYVRADPPADAPEQELDRHFRRNQCFCHGDRNRSGGWISHHDPNPYSILEFAYVLGDTAMVVDIPGTRQGVWWKAAEVAWEQPHPDWEHLHEHDYP